MSCFEGKNLFRSCVLMIGTLATSSAMAHSSSTHALMSFGSGFAHPFSGVDHMLAMLAVGLWTMQQRRNAPVWLLPLIFLLMMTLGAVFGVMGVHVPGVEMGIAASVAVLGVLIAFAVSLPIWAGAITVSAFAIMHGYAHGLEISNGASVHLYGAGLVLATGLLHLIGMCLAHAATYFANHFAHNALAGKVLRIGGVAIAATGASLLLA